MILLILGTIRLPPANLDRARLAMRAMTEASRAEDGCIAYGYAEDVLDRGLIHVKEMWRDRAALERHFRSDHIAVWRSKWPDFGLRERDLSLYEVSDATPV